MGGEGAGAERGLEEAEGEEGLAADAKDDLSGFGWGEGGSGREGGLKAVPAGFGAVVEEDGDGCGDAGFGFGFGSRCAGGERAGDLSWGR